MILFCYVQIAITAAAATAFLRGAEPVAWLLLVASWALLGLDTLYQERKLKRLRRTRSDLQRIRARLEELNRR